jgi:hypothetical protein
MIGVEAIERVYGTHVSLRAGGSNSQYPLVESSRVWESDLLCEVAILILQSRKETDAEAERVVTNAHEEVKRWSKMLAQRDEDRRGHSRR